MLIFVGMKTYGKSGFDWNILLLSAQTIKYKI